ncbi:hypothetical protein [Kitasatospora sp. NPDC001175]|uniref:hypothetical protein n=1 Tax=Kitasatospora sp. NPDC001175 TaxID=3157103 RepID=UPI003CFDD2C9
MTSRSGLIPGGNPCVLTGSGMTGTIGVGRAVIQGTASQGAYPVAVTAPETITVANGHNSLPRIDSVFLVAYDALYDTSGLTAAAVVYVQGTAAATPAAPTIPPTGTAYMKLWDIAVPAGASVSAPINWSTALTDQRQYTVAVGGITPSGSAVGAYVGQYRDNPASGTLERWSGTAWAPPLGVWQAFSTTWAGATTNPSIGNGTITARYCQVGKRVDVVIKIVGGTTTNYGSGTWTWTTPPGLPFAAHYYSGLGATVGTAYADRSPSAGAGPSLVWVQDSTHVRAFTTVASTSWSDSNPWVPVTTSINSYSLEFTYETP